MKLLALLFGCTLLPACAINTTSTTLVPGKELSRHSLGTKTTTDRFDLTVINPYTVSIKKVHCTVEQLNVAYQGLTEIKHETYPLDCSDAYLEYVVQNATTLGVPFLYDTFTGFYIFRDKCVRKAPLTMVSTRESKEIIRQEIDDKNSTTCKETPIAGALVKAELSSNVLDLVTDRDGKASLPSQKLAELDRSKSNSPIKFSYEASVAETIYIPKPQPQQNGMMRADLNGMSENEAAGLKLDNQDTQMMAKLNDEIAIKTGEAKKSSPAESDLQLNKMSKDMNSVAGAKKDGTDMMAKRDTENAAIKASPALMPLSLETSNATTAGSGNETQGQLLPAEADELKPRLVVYFDVNRTTVKKEFRGKLKELADEIKANSALSTSIEGHTDNTGSAEINLKMSLKRAEAIKNYLVKTLGVPEKRIKVKGFGLTKPIRSNDTESGRSANRRTEVIIITQLSAI